MPTIRRFEDLECWKEARKLVSLVYGLTRKQAFAKDFNLVGQVRDSANSAMSNIAEGLGRNSNREFLRFLDVSRASVAETVSHCYTALDQSYITQSEMDSLHQQADVVSKKVNSLIRYLSRSSRTRHATRIPPTVAKATGTRTIETNKTTRPAETIETSTTSATNETNKTNRTSETDKTNKTDKTNGTNKTNSPIPYGRQSVQEDDIREVVEVLRSDWLTTGPKVAEFEEAFARLVGAGHAVAVSSGTAALHAAMHAVGIGPGDEVIVPAMTFAATANCVVFQGGTPVFADVDPETLLLDQAQVEARITPRTRAIIAVDYAGQPCDYDPLREIARRHALALVADACHSLGGTYKGRPVGALADLSCFSFHPVKHITTGEGGMVTTDDPELARHMQMFRNHGITTDHRQREAQGSWFYEMADLGYNYRITDFQCALGISQLRRLSAWVARRQEIARRYDAAFKEMPGIRPLRVREDVGHAYHLYVVRLDRSQLPRTEVFSALRAQGIGVNVHYIPVHLHPFYRRRFGTGPGLCPVAEAAYEEILSLPMFPAMSDRDIDVVIAALRTAARHT